MMKVNRTSSINKPCLPCVYFLIKHNFFHFAMFVQIMQTVGGVWVAGVQGACYDVIYLFYLGFTAQVLKVCRTPGPTAR